MHRHSFQKQLAASRIRATYYSGDIGRIHAAKSRRKLVNWWPDQGVCIYIYIILPFWPGSLHPRAWRLTSDDDDKKVQLIPQKYRRLVPRTPGSPYKDARRAPGHLRRGNFTYSLVEIFWKILIGSKRQHMQSYAASLDRFWLEFV